MRDYVNGRKPVLGASRKPRRRRRRIVSLFFIGTLVLFVLAIISSVATFAWFARDLPTPDRIKRREGFATIIFDREGETLYDIYADERRIPIEISQVPDHLKNATVAIEDKEFYTHEGYSTRGILRSLFQIVVYRNLQGGSTLTQQLVKNVLLTSERTLPRKIKEFILAVQIEQRYSKDEILQMYLNEAPYGGTAWGVESAAEQYFGKTVSELTLVESAILAGLPQRPSAYSPYSGTPDAYVGRTEDVLRRMREDGYISREEEEEAQKDLASVAFKGRTGSFKAPHFVEYVRKELVARFGDEVVESGGLRVTTTLDSVLQAAAEDILREEIEKIEALKVSNGAIVVLDPKTGEILSMIGSKDYNADERQFEGKFNVAAQGMRQPGSALKPVVYAAAFQEGYTPASLIMDVPTEFPGGEGQKPYDPKNYDGKFRGPVQMRFALANSINVSAVKTLALTGVEDMLQTAYSMGLKTLEPTKENMSRFGLSVALGGGEVTLLDLTSAYGVFATAGVRHEPVTILQVKDRSGKTIFDHKQTRGEQVLEPEIAFLISDILADNNARKDVFGPNSWLNIAAKTVAVKTGTTDDKRDNWTVGFTKEITIGVWVGNNDNSPMDPKLASGTSGAAPIWNRVMREALRNHGDGFIERPDSVIQRDVDALGGGLPKDGEPTRKEYFIEGTEPARQSAVYQTIKLSRRQQGKRASDDEIRVGDYDERNYIVFSENDPISSDGRNRWQEGIDKWLETVSEDRYKPPKEVSDVTIQEEKKDEEKKEEEKKEEPTPTRDSDPTPTEDAAESPTPSPAP